MKIISSGTLLLSLIFFSPYINAKTYLCISGATVGIKIGKSIPAKATNYADNDKFILQEVNNKWSLKKVGGGMKPPIWPCETEYHCGTHVGKKDVIPHNIFWRSDNVYTMTSSWMDSENGWTEGIFQRGICEVI